MNFSKNNNGHKDFTAHTSQDTDCRLSPKHDNRGTAHYHAKADVFTKDCMKPSLNPSDSHKSYIKDHD